LKVYDKNSRIRIPDPKPDPDPFVRSMDTRIRIHPKMSCIRNTDLTIRFFPSVRNPELKMMEVENSLAEKFISELPDDLSEARVIAEVRFCFRI
jgi:hypothetical protein